MREFTRSFTHTFFRFFSSEGLAYGTLFWLGAQFHRGYQVELVVALSLIGAVVPLLTRLGTRKLVPGLCRACGGLNEHDMECALYGTEPFMRQFKQRNPGVSDLTAQIALDQVLTSELGKARDQI